MPEGVLRALRVAKVPKVPKAGYLTLLPYIFPEKEKCILGIAQLFTTKCGNFFAHSDLSCDWLPNEDIT